MRYFNTMTEIEKENFIMGIPKIPILSAMKREKDYKITPVKVKVTEDKDTHDFSYFIMIDTKTKEWIFIKKETPETKDQAREIRKQKRFPQNLYGVLITKGIGDNEKTQVIIKYCERSEKIAQYEIINAIISDFLEYKDIQTLPDVSAYLKKWEQDTEKEYTLQQMIQSGELFRNRNKYRF